MPMAIGTYISPFRLKLQFEYIVWLQIKPHPLCAMKFSTARQLTLLLLAAAALFFAALGHLPLLEPDEGRNAEVAREMLVTHDYITPHYDSLPYLDKPAFFFWLVAGSFKVMGITEFAARFPSALMAAATMMLTWLLGRRMFSGNLSWKAAIIFATSPLVISFSRTVIFDMTLCFLVTVAFWAFWEAEQQPAERLRWDCLAFASMGVAAITKGPVGFLLPLFTLAAFYAARGRFRELKHVRWAAGWGVLLATALPWFIMVSVRNPFFPKYAFWQESLLRFATASSHRSGGIMYYIPVFLAGAFPWSFFVLFAGGNRWRHWRLLRTETYTAHLFLLCEVATIFVFFSISRSKLPGYFLPAMPAVALLMAWVWQDVESSVRPPDWLTGGFATLMLIGLLVAASPQLLHIRAIRLEGLHKVPHRVFNALPASLQLSGGILLVLGFLGRSLSHRISGPRLARTAFLLLALTTPLLILRWLRPIQEYVAENSSRDLARAILASPQRNMTVIGYYYFRTGLPFYMQRSVGLVTTDGDEISSNYVIAQLPAMRLYPLLQNGSSNSIHLLLGSSEFSTLLQSSTPPFLLMLRNTHVNQVQRIAPDLEPMWTGWQFSVWQVNH
jgi:4-amino-4-deoxy-L-arabinose transferase-like glycosyltransferase